MVLMMVLFPLLSLLLAAWMTIFGFYLRLEEKQWQRYCDSSTSNLSFIKYVFNKNLFFLGPCLFFFVSVCCISFSCEDPPEREESSFGEASDQRMGESSTFTQQSLTSATASDINL